jgi:putative addiction module killer protein
MDVVPRTVRLYVTASGASPFETWFDHLADARAQQRILARMARLRLGNPGDWKALGGGLFELRVDYGPGYRVYFGQEGNETVILVGGGMKRTQERDIKRARDCWHEYATNQRTEDF